MKTKTTYILLFYMLLAFIYNKIINIEIKYNILILIVLFIPSLLILKVVKKYRSGIIVSPIILINFIVLMVYYLWIEKEIPNHIYSFLGSFTAMYVIETIQNKNS